VAWRQTGRRIYAWFAERFNLADLKDATALLLAGYSLIGRMLSLEVALDQLAAV